MKFINRNISSYLSEIGKYFPIISLTGPRQAGKTTLLTTQFPTYRYVSLEDPDIREKAVRDPRSFLKKYNSQVIFDEVQRVPELFSYLQTLVDEERTPSRFILSSSQNFLLRQNINQSLAGRVGIARLFPLDTKELKAAKLLETQYEPAIFRGFYPSLFDTQIPPHLFYPSYEFSYVERDVRGIISANNLGAFQVFIRLCAANVGQTVNYSSFASSVGVSVNTIKSWFSVLEQSYILFRLSPYFKNFGKRLIKSPKLYFYDTGLLCHLLEIDSEEAIDNYPRFGALFENLVIADLMKQSYHSGKMPQLYFYRDSNQLEVDLLEETSNKYRLTEIKATRTFRASLLKGLNTLNGLVDKPSQLRLIYGGEEAFEIESVEIRPWFE